MARVLAIDTYPAQDEAPLHRRLQRDHGHEISAIFGAEALHWQALAKRVWQTRPEVILWSDCTSEFTRRAMAQLALVPIPWVLQAATSDHLLQRSQLKDLARDALMRAVYARSSALAYIGQRSQRHCQRLAVPERKLFFAPLAVDTSMFQAGESDRARLRRACRSELQVPERRALFMFCGKLTEPKDPLQLVHALRALPALLRQRASLVFVGEGELASELTQLAAAEPHVDARVVGKKAQAQLSAYYHAADALVSSSRTAESWGRVVNEALHHGTPCIVSHRVGCAPDLIVPAQTGEIFEAGNAESLARAIARIWPRLGTLACREQARARVSSYSLDAASSGIATALSYALRGRMFAFR